MYLLAIYIVKDRTVLQVSVQKICPNNFPQTHLKYIFNFLPLIQPKINFGNTIEMAGI
jgi:hypothetical protein